tara:strand:+ start:32 stop:784 length:753 start_codon:yes stop_codon:yes gene_type:complete
MSADTAYANNNDYYVHILGLHSGVDVKFKAFLTNFSDAWSTKFNSEEVYGRMDPIMTFQNTTRKLTIDFDVPSAGNAEATENLTKLSQLAASMYPGFASAAGGASTISTAPLHKIKFANWATSGGAMGAVNSNGLVVAMEGVTFAPNLDAGVIELADGKINPKLFSLSLSMTVLHTEQVGWNLGFWMGSENYPYTDKVDARGQQSFGPTQEEFEQQEEAYQQAMEDYMLDQQQGAGAVSGGPEMSLAIYE